MKISNSASTRKQQRGAGIVSVLLGLVIAAGLAAVIYDNFSDSKRKTRIEAAASEIVTMVSQSQKTYGNANQFGAVTTAVAVSGGVVPGRLRVAGTSTAQNTYNGAITFTPTTITTANDSLTLGYGGVNNVDCQELVFASEKLMRSVSVGSTAVKPADGVVDVGLLTTECDRSDKVDISFTFGRQ